MIVKVLELGIVVVIEAFNNRVMVMVGDRIVVVVAYTQVRAS